METKPLHILFLCSWYPNPESKSNGIFIKRHAQALAKKHQVTVLFAKAVNDVEDISTIQKQEDNLVEHIRFYHKLKHNIPVLGILIKLFRFHREYKELINALPTNQSFDVIHLNTIFPAVIPALYTLKKYPQAKLFITEHWSGYYPEDGNYKGSFMIALTKKIIKKAQAVFVISEKLKLAMLSHQLNANYELVNNVVDTEIFKPTNERVQSDILKIIHVSSLVNREKNIDGIITIAEQLSKKNKPYHLTIVGENVAEIDAYKKVLTQKSLVERVTFVGYKPPVEVAAHMNQSDVFLLFSHFEGMPVVLLEALACGLPVITTPVGAVKQMINPNMGSILNAHAVNECVVNLINFKRDEYTSSSEMHEYIKINYSKAAVCNSLTNLYIKYSTND